MNPDKLKFCQENLFHYAAIVFLQVNFLECCKNGHLFDLVSTLNRVH